MAGRKVGKPGTSSNTNPKMPKTNKITINPKEANKLISGLSQYNLIDDKKFNSNYSEDSEYLGKVFDELIEKIKAIATQVEKSAITNGNASIDVKNFIKFLQNEGKNNIKLLSSVYKQITPKQNTAKAEIELRLITLIDKLQSIETMKTHANSSKTEKEDASVSKIQEYLSHIGIENDKLRRVHSYTFSPSHYIFTASDYEMFDRITKSSWLNGNNINFYAKTLDDLTGINSLSASSIYSKLLDDPKQLKSVSTDSLTDLISTFRSGSKKEVDAVFNELLSRNLDLYETKLLMGAIKQSKFHYSQKEKMMNKLSEPGAINMRSTKYNEWKFNSNDADNLLSNFNKTNKSLVKIIEELGHNMDINTPKMDSIFKNINIHNLTIQELISLMDNATDDMLTKLTSEFNTRARTQDEFKSAYDKLRSYGKEGLLQNGPMGLIESIKQLQNNVKEFIDSFDGLGEIMESIDRFGRKVWDKWKEIWDAEDAIRKTTGLIRNNTEYLQNSFMDSRKMTQWGVTMDDIANSIITTSDVFGDMTYKNFPKLIESATIFGKQIGMDAGSATELYSNMLLMTNQSEKSVEQTMSNYLSLGRNLEVNVASALKDISSNTELFAKFSKDGGSNIFEASIYAKKLGTNLSNVSKIAEHLLNFESSVTSQVKASVILGKQLNLDKARQLAFVGDFTGMMGELTNQINNTGKSWENLNYIERTSFAEAMGMSVEELNKYINKSKLAGMSTAEFRKEVLKSKDILSFKDMLSTDQIQGYNAFMMSLTSLLTSMATALEPIMNVAGKVFGWIANFINWLPKGVTGTMAWGMSIMFLITRIPAAIGLLTSFTSKIKSVVAAMGALKTISAGSKVGSLFGSLFSKKGGVGDIVSDGGLGGGPSKPSTPADVKKVTDGVNTMTQGTQKWWTGAAKFALYAAITAGAIYAIKKASEGITPEMGLGLLSLSGGMLAFSGVLLGLSALVSATGGLGGGIMLATTAGLAAAIALIGNAVSTIPADANNRLVGVTNGIAFFVGAMGSISLKVLDDLINKVDKIDALTTSLNSLGYAMSGLNGSITIDKNDNLTVNKQVNGLLGTDGSSDNAIVNELRLLRKAVEGSKVSIEPNSGNLFNLIHNYAKNV